MEFSRAMLAASASVLGLLLYIVGALFGVLAIVSVVQARADAPPLATVVIVAVCFVAAGAVCRFIARKIA